MDHVARRKVLTGFLVVFFVETAKKFLEDSTHVKIRHSRKRQTVGVFSGLVSEIDVWVGDFLYQREQAIAVSEFASLVEKLEFVKHVLHVMAKSEQVFCEVI